MSHTFRMELGLFVEPYSDSISEHHQDEVTVGGVTISLYVTGSTQGRSSVSPQWESPFLVPAYSVAVDGGGTRHSV